MRYCPNIFVTFSWTMFLVKNGKKSYSSLAFLFRFSYDASEFFDRKDNLSLIRPAPSASKNGWSLSSTPVPKATKDVNTVTDFEGDDEENKRE
jgi:hypothetical protein